MESWDVVVPMGSGLLKPGQMDPFGDRRVAVACMAVLAKLAWEILCVGSYNHPASGKCFAEVACEAASSRGIPEAKIWHEPHPKEFSVDTRGDVAQIVRFAARCSSLSSILIVTEYPHWIRVRLELLRQGWDGKIGFLSSKNPVTIKYWAKEMIALFVSFLPVKVQARIDGAYHRISDKMRGGS